LVTANGGLRLRLNPPYELTGVWLGGGTQAPTEAELPLLMRSFDAELLLCKRYFALTTAAIDFPNSAAVATTAAGSNWPVEMRITPATTFTASITSNIAGIVLAGASNIGATYQFNGSTAARFYWYGTVTLNARM
jgi:hypothetical protein